MDIMQALYTRRSIRKYKNMEVPREIIDKLIEAATMAPSASNSQPWSFVVIQNSTLLKEYSDRAKIIFLNYMKDKPDPYGYKTTLANPDFNIFYNAGSLVLIYGNESINAYGDCCLAAQNFMLAAHAQGLGTCWVGFSTGLFDSPEFKSEMKIPLSYRAVAPLIIGYPEITPSAYKRNPPQVLIWK